MDRSDYSNVKLSDEFFHISFTPTNWLSDPWKCLEAAERWTRIDSGTVPEFDCEGFIEKYSRVSTVLGDVEHDLGGNVVDDRANNGA